MSHDVALIPCEVCNNLFTIDEYMTHTATHQLGAHADYSTTGNMYGPHEGGMGPFPKPKGYVDPDPTTTTTTTTNVNWDYTVLPDGSISYNNGDMYGATKSTNKSATDAKTDDSKNEMNDEKKNEIQDISVENANSIRDNGCAIIKNGIRKDLIKNALRVINNALSNGPQCLKNDEYRKNNDILDLFNESAAFSLCQNVLGLANVVIPKLCEIGLVFPVKNEMDEKQIESLDLNWNIDVDGISCLAPYSLGMRMVLSKQKFRFYTGTHEEVFNALKKDGMDKFIEKNKKEKDRQEWDREKNKLEEWDVDKGDIILYHPFLCLPLIESNNTENIEYYVNFKVNHKNFNKDIGRKRAHHLWLGYEKLQNALINEVLTI